MVVPVCSPELKIVEGSGDGSRSVWASLGSMRPYFKKQTKFFHTWGDDLQAGWVDQ